MEVKRFYQKFVVSSLAVLIILSIGAITIFAGGAKEATEKYPSKSITYIIPFNPGGQSDITAQYQKDALQKVLGVNIIIKYMPGAGGAVAWSNLVIAKPDGYTISGNNIPHIIVQPLVRKKAGYKTEQLIPVYMFETTPIGLAVLKSSQFKTLDDFLSYAKEHPGEITVGGSGTHTGHHLALLELQKLSNAKFTYIPSTGAAPSVANFLGGHTQALFANSNDLVQYKDKIRILAIGTDKKFLPYFPDVPTFKELGINMTAGIDRGVCVPPGTPGNVIKTLEDAFDKVCNGKTFVNKMTQLGFLVRHLKSKEFKKYIEQKSKEYTQTLKELGQI